MCEAHVFVIENGEEKKVLSDVDVIEFEGNKVILKNIFGEQKILSGVEFRSYNNQERKILFER